MELHTRDWWSKGERDKRKKAQSRLRELSDINLRHGARGETRDTVRSVRGGLEEWKMRDTWVAYNVTSVFNTSGSNSHIFIINLALVTSCVIKKHDILEWFTISPRSILIILIIDSRAIKNPRTLADNYDAHRTVPCSARFARECARQSQAIN